jgi:transposase
VTQAEIDAGSRLGTTATEVERLVELEREVEESRRANTILRSAAVFFSAELNPPGLSSSTTSISTRTSSDASPASRAAGETAAFEDGRNDSLECVAGSKSILTSPAVRECEQRLRT